MHLCMHEQYLGLCYFNILEFTPSTLKVHDFEMMRRILYTAKDYLDLDQKNHNSAQLLCSKESKITLNTTLPTITDSSTLLRFA
jgi:hypothetical protein